MGRACTLSATRRSQVLVQLLAALPWDPYHGRVKTEFAKKLAAAIDEVGAAEGNLAELLAQIRVAPRAEKTSISRAVEEALARLRLGRANLIDLQKLVVSDDE